MGEYDGKYVCYGSAEGKFCWGRIVGEAKVNTVLGLKEVFILEDRMTGPYGTRAASGQKHKKNPKMVPNVEKHKGRTILQKDAIDLKKDIVDRDLLGEGRLLDEVTDEQLFVMVLSGELQAEGMNRGLANMIMAQENGLEDVLKKEMNKRMGQKV